MALVKTAALNPPVIERYLNYVGIRGKATDAGAFGIENADVAIYFPSLDGKSYSGITFSEHPAAQFQTFKLHVFPKESIKNHFLGALSSHRMGKATLPPDVLNPIINAINDSSSKANSQLANTLSTKLSESLNAYVRQATPELAQYGVSSLQAAPIKSLLGKNTELQPAVVKALYQGDAEPLKKIIFQVASIEVPKNILTSSKDKIFEFISQSLDNQTKHVAAEVMSRVIKVDSQFKAFLAAHLSAKTKGQKPPPTTPPPEGGAGKTASVRLAAGDPEINMYIARIPDEEVSGACKEAFLAYLNDIYRKGVHEGDMGMFGDKKGAAGIEIKKITTLVHAVNQAAPIIDIDILGILEIESSITAYLKDSPDNQIEGVIGSNFDFGANFEVLKTLMLELIKVVPEFKQMFGNESGTPAGEDQPSITKKGDKINIVSLTNRLPDQYSNWDKKIRDDLRNPRVIQQLEMIK